MLTYTRYEDGTKIEDPVRIGDHVLQTAYGKGLGRLEDCGRRGLVTDVNRVTVRVHFGDQHTSRLVHPDVLRLERRAFSVAADTTDPA